MSIPSCGLRSTEDFSEDYSIRPCWIRGACSKVRTSRIIVLLNSLIDWMMWTLHFDLNEVMLVMVRIEKWRENLPRRVVHFFARTRLEEDRVFSVIFFTQISQNLSTHRLLIERQGPIIKVTNFAAVLSLILYLNLFHYFEGLL